MSDKMTDEEAIEALTDEDVVNPYLTLEALEIAIDALKKRAERKTGKWIHTNGNTFKCSICGNFLNFHGVNAGRGDANYCPNCGAKMEVDECGR